MLKLLTLSAESGRPGAKVTDSKGRGPRVRLSSRYLLHSNISTAPPNTQVRHKVLTAIEGLCKCFVLGFFSVFLSSKRTLVFSVGGGSLRPLKPREERLKLSSSVWLPNLCSESLCQLDAGSLCQELWEGFLARGVHYRAHDSPHRWGATT